MKNKIIVMAGLTIILIIGLVSVLAIGTQNKSWYDHKNWKKDGDHSYRDFEDKSAWLEKMGLPSNATEAQIIETKKELWGQDKDYMINIREKLGLADDASEEEVKEAMQEWKEENKFYSKKNYHGSGFNKGSCGKY